MVRSSAIVLSIRPVIGPYSAGRLRHLPALGLALVVFVNAEVDSGKSAWLIDFTAIPSAAHAYVTISKTVGDRNAQTRDLILSPGGGGAKNQRAWERPTAHHTPGARWRAQTVLRNCASAPRVLLARWIAQRFFYNAIFSSTFALC